MSLHIIKCKTILKINEIETINLTQYLNFYRHVEPGENACEGGGVLWDYWGLLLCSAPMAVAVRGSVALGEGGSPICPVKRAPD